MILGVKSKKALDFSNAFFDCKLFELYLKFVFYFFSSFDHSVKFKFGKNLVLYIFSALIRLKL